MAESEPESWVEAVGKSTDFIIGQDSYPEKSYEEMLEIIRSDSL